MVTARRVKDIFNGSGGSAPDDLLAVGELLLFSADDGRGRRSPWQSDGSAAGTIPRAETAQPAAAGAAPSMTAPSMTAVAVTAPTGLRIDPAAWVRLGSSDVFAADDGSRGFELWRRDGDGGVPLLVADLNPGPGGSAPSDLTVVGQTLFFVADDGRSGRELWRLHADGGAPQLVADLLPGGEGANPGFLTPVGQALFFVADNGSHGMELWRLDASSADASGPARPQLIDINPGGDGSFPAFLTAVGGQLFFSATDGRSGFELWSSDGSVAGTQRLADLNPGAASANPGLLTLAGKRLFFAADDGSSGDELWCLDLGAAEAPPLLSISALSADQPEGDSGFSPFSFLVRRSGGASGGCRVRWAVSVDGATAASAEDFRDGLLPAGDLVFAAGETEKILQLELATDRLLEADEGFRITLLEATGAGVDPAAGSASGTILNDDSNRWLIGTVLADSLEGGGGDDLLEGLAGNDSLDGGSGNDTLIGGAGHDVYWVDSLADAIIDSSGSDTIRSTLSYSLLTLPAIENLWLQASAIEGFGNALNNRLYGNSDANTLRGFGADDDIRGANGNDTLIGDEGNDSLDGGTGNDTLIGDEGNDSLDGGTGNDTLIGGAGHDVYGVDSLADAIIDSSGNDTIRSSLSYSLLTLPAIENLMLQGSAIEGHGNALNNRLYGNSDANTLGGFGGDDDIRGANGNDTLIGGEGHDNLGGQLAADLLIGGPGNDTLSGGAGADRFLFEDPILGGCDLLLDFNSDEGDRIALAASGFAGLESGPLAAAAFSSGSRFSDAAQRILSTGSALFYDPDGDGPLASTRFAWLNGGSVVSAADLVVV